jgi:hypothetical protein
MNAPEKIKPWLAVWSGMAMLLMSWLVWRAGLPLHIDRNEAWNAWHATHAFSATQLYPAINDLVVNNYPPLSFVLIKLMALGHDPLWVGRYVSMASLLTVALCAGWIVRLLAASGAFALFSALWCIALFAGLFPNYVGMNDPSLLALGIMMIGVANWIKATMQGRTPYLGCAIVVLALFCKHNLLAFPIALLIWQFRLDRRQAMYAFACCLGLGLLGLAICVNIYGPIFFQQLLAPREFVWLNGFKLFRQFLPMLPALVYWWRWKPSAAQQSSADLIKIMLGTSFVLDFIQRCAPGVDYNAQFEFAVALALTLGCAAHDRLGSTSLVKLNALLLACLVLFSNRIEPYLFAFSPQYRHAVDVQAATALAERDRIQRMPGRVACDLMTTCYLAGKPFEYDDFGMRQRVAKGIWSAQRLEAEMANRQLRIEHINRDAEWQDQDLMTRLKSTGASNSR